MSSTPARSIRIPDKLWVKAKAKAKRDHTTVSAIVVKALLDWVGEN